MKTKVKSLLAEKMKNYAYRKRHKEGYDLFKLEVQFLNAMEKKNWSYKNLAKATHTSKSNISRDLKAGGILSASFSRITRMADVLGMKLVALLIPKDQTHFMLARIEEIVQSSFNELLEATKELLVAQKRYNSRLDNSHDRVAEAEDRLRDLIAKAKRYKLLRRKS